MAFALACSFPRLRRPSLFDASILLRRLLRRLRRFPAPCFARLLRLLRPLLRRSRRRHETFAPKFFSRQKLFWRQNDVIFGHVGNVQALKRRRRRGDDDDDDDGGKRQKEEEDETQ